jgi:hypothetical protein
MRMIACLRERATFDRIRIRDLRHRNADRDDDDGERCGLHGRAGLQL